MKREGKEHIEKQIDGIDYQFSVSYNIDEGHAFVLVALRGSMENRMRFRKLEGNQKYYAKMAAEILNKVDAEKQFSVASNPISTSEEWVGQFKKGNI